MPWLAEETDLVLVRSSCPGRVELETRLDCVKLHTVSPWHKDSCSQAPPPKSGYPIDQFHMRVHLAVSCLQKLTEKTIGLAWTRNDGGC